MFYSISNYHLKIDEITLHYFYITIITTLHFTIQCIRDDPSKLAVTGSTGHDLSSNWSTSGVVW